MIIETKFEVNDKAYLMAHNKVSKTKIIGIEIIVNEYEPSISYEIDNPDGTHRKWTVPESDLFKTKQDLLDSL